MTKETRYIVLERFTAKNPEEYRLKKAISNLDSPFGEYIDEARQILKKAGKKALPYLQEAMEQKWFAESALWDDVPGAFADIGVPAIPVLTKWLRNDDPYFHSTAISALEEIGSPSVTAICKVISDPDEEVRIRAINLLGEIGDTRATPYLIKALSDDGGEVSFEIKEALIGIGPSCYSLILPLLHSDNEQLVCNAIEILPGLDREKGIEVIMPYFADPRDEVCDAVFDSLLYLDPKPESEMCHYLSCGIPEVMAGAMNILGNIGGEKAITAIQRLLDYPDPDIRESAAWWIKRIKEKGTS